MRTRHTTYDFWKTDCDEVIGIECYYCGNPASELIKRLWVCEECYREWVSIEEYEYQDRDDE